MKQYLIFLALSFSINSFSMHREMWQRLSCSPSIETLFTHTTATVHTPPLLFMNLVTEASKNPQFKQYLSGIYVSGIAYNYYYTHHDRVTTPAQAFAHMLNFILWDGIIRSNQEHRVNVNDVLVDIGMRTYHSESIPDAIHSIVVIPSANAELLHPEHYQSVMKRYEELAKE